MTKAISGLVAGRKPGHSNKKVHWIVDFIRQERVRQGLSQETLGRRIGEGHQNISSYEAGYYGIRAVLTVERILNALGYELRIHKRKK